MTSAIKSLVNSMFTKDFIIHLISSCTADYILSQNNLGTRNKIKACLHLALNKQCVYSHTVECNEEYNKSRDRLVLFVTLKPTVISPEYSYKITTQLLSWDANLVDRFTLEEYVRLHANAQILVDRIK